MEDGNILNTNEDPKLGNIVGSILGSVDGKPLGSSDGESDRS